MIRLLLIGVFIVAATWWLLSVLFPTPKEEKKEEKVKTPLERLKELLSQELLCLEKDEVSRVAGSICEIGHDLLSGHKENEVTRGILDQYKVYLDGYVDSAVSMTGKYRKAEKYIATVKPEDIHKDIEALEKRVKAGSTILEKTLKERKDTLRDLEIIRKSMDKTLVSLMEIQATLLSLQASIVSVETGDKNEVDAREDMQRSISTLSQALDKTFEELEQHEPLKKELKTNNL